MAIDLKLVAKPKLPKGVTQRQFATGAVRDTATGKGSPSSIPPAALRRMALRFEIGGENYGRGNWMKGLPLSSLYDSAQRHMWAWSEGCKKEDHLGAALWNLSVAAWTEEQIKAGKLPKELDDLLFNNHDEHQPTPSRRQRGAKKLPRGGKGTI